MPTFLAGVFEGPAEREINDLRAIPGALCGKGQILRLPRYGAFERFLVGPLGVGRGNCIPYEVDQLLKTVFGLGDGEFGRHWFYLMRRSILITYYPPKPPSFQVVFWPLQRGQCSGVPAAQLYLIETVDCRQWNSTNSAEQPKGMLFAEISPRSHHSSQPFLRVFGGPFTHKRALGARRPSSAGGRLGGASGGRIASSTACHCGIKSSR